MEDPLEHKEAIAKDFGVMLSQKACIIFISIFSILYILFRLICFVLYIFRVRINKIKMRRQDVEAPIFT